eukprot:508154_1
MGNICTSPKNNLSTEDRPVRNTERSNLITSSKPIDKWDVDDVFEWLSRIDDGALYELAIKFKKNKIRGCILDNVKEVQLVEMDVALGDRMLFEKLKNELFRQYNYMPNNILMDQHSNQSNQLSNPNAPHPKAHSIHSNHSIHLNHSHNHEGKEGTSELNNICGPIPDDNISHHSITSMPKPSSSLSPQPPIHMFHHNHIRHPSAPIYIWVIHNIIIISHHIVIIIINIILIVVCHMLHIIHIHYILVHQMYQLYQILKCKVIHHHI